MTSPASERPRAVSQPSAGSAVTVPLIAESATLHKVTVDRGGVRVSKRVVTDDATVDVDLLRREVEVERRPVGRMLAAGDTAEPRQEGDTWVLPVLREVLVTEKRLVLVEEVRIRTVERRITESNPVALRREEVTVEDLHPAATPDDPAGRGPPGADRATARIKEDGS